jgi:hypothetical protein
MLIKTKPGQLTRPLTTSAFHLHAVLYFIVKIQDPIGIEADATFGSPSSNRFNNKARMRAKSGVFRTTTGGIGRSIAIPSIVLEFTTYIAFISNDAFCVGHGQQSFTLRDVVNVSAGNLKRNRISVGIPKHVNLGRIAAP